MNDVAETKPMPNLTIWKISLPIFIEFLFTFSVFFTDTFFLSRISDLAAASVGSIIPIFMVFVFLLMMLSQGSGGVAAQFLGGSRPEDARCTYQTSLIINAMVGIVLTLMFMLFHGYLGPILGMPAQASKHVSQYLLYLAPAMLFISLKSAYNAMVFSQGKTVWNLYTALLVNVVNVIANCMLVLGWATHLRLGVAGVALSTVFAQFTAVLFLSHVVYRKLDITPARKNTLDHLKKYAKPILNIGIPASIEPISSELGMLTLAYFIIHLGVEAMAARMYVMNLLLVAMCWSSALAIGNQVLVAHQVGASKFKGADQTLKKNLIITCAGSLVIMALVSAICQPLLTIFTQNHTIIALAVPALLMGLLIEPARAAGYVSAYALKGVGDAKFPTCAAVLITWGIAIPLAYYLGFTAGLGFIGIWCGLLIDEVLRAGINYWRWQQKVWMSTGVMQSQPSAAETT